MVRKFSLPSENKRSIAIYIMIKVSVGVLKKFINPEYFLSTLAIYILLNAMDCLISYAATTSINIEPWTIWI